MILDELLEFCDATALNTGAAGTYLLGDVIDLGDAPTTQGIGAFGTQPVYLVIQVDTAATSGGAATGRFILASDAQAAIATDGTATVHFDSGAIAVASLTAGRLITITGLPLTRTYERYLGILQTTAVAAFTAGKINAFLTTDISSWAALPQAPNAAP
jgi:hypothetical protein